MPGSSHLPAHLPIGAKYVLESQGQFVRRYIELPGGRRIHLATRKAPTCTCAAREVVSIVPDQSVVEIKTIPQRLRVAT